MKRIISKNPWRTEKNKDSFDYFTGKFVVSYASFVHEFPYTGNNIEDSNANRRIAKYRAESWFNAFKYFYNDIVLIEKEL